MAKSALLNCPVCERPAHEKFQPFCSARCANIDLGKWLGEKYRVQTEESPSNIKNDDEGSEIE